MKDRKESAFLPDFNAFCLEQNLHDLKNPLFDPASSPGLAPEIGLTG